MYYKKKEEIIMKKKNLIMAGILGCICATATVPYTYGVVRAEANLGEDITTSEVTTDDNIITFEPAYTVVDDDNLRLQIDSVQKVEDTEFLQYNINLNIENKNQEHDVDCTVSTDSCSVNGYMVTFGNDGTPTKAGKKNDSAKYTCTISKNNGQFSSDGSEHIKSLKDLLTFEATARVSLYDYTGDAYLIVDKYPINISLADAAVEGTSATAEEIPSFELIDGIKFGDTREQVNEKLKSAENCPKMDTVYTSADEYFMQGYSSETEFDLAFKINLEGYCSSVICVYEGDEGGLVDLHASVAGSDDESYSDVFAGLQAKITDKYGEPVADADIEHRSGIVGFAYDEFVDLQSHFDESVEVKNYSEWNLPEYNTKIEMFLAESGESEYVYIDYRYQE